MRRVRVVMIPYAPVVSAGDRRIERREDPARIVAIDPNVPIEMRLEHVSFVRCSLGILDHRVVGQFPAARHACANTRFSTATNSHRAVALRLVDENRRLAEVGVATLQGEAFTESRGCPGEGRGTSN